MKIRWIPIAAAAMTLAVWLTAPPASAHGGPGKIEVVDQSDSGPMQVTYTVDLSFTGDGDPIEGATVTARAIPPSGATPAAVPMKAMATEGRYSASITFPSSGQWTVRFTAIADEMEPAATLEVKQDVDVSTTGVPSTTAAATTAPGSTTIPASVTTAVLPATTPASSSTDDDGSALPWVLGALGVAVVIGGGLLLARSRKGA